ncbi:hypothetical protein Ancab_035666 [Ancistrocladus abbreviatus]
MVLHVEITSTDYIKPKSPTPQHLRTLKLSFLDQQAPPFYIPLIFFYKNDISYCFANHTERSQLLKQSLSSILVHFYPLAGRVGFFDAFVDCNDEGVQYLETKVSTDISKVIEDPNTEDLEGLLPFEPHNISKNTVLGIQVNCFDCGGMAIGVCASHRIVDATAFCTFMNAWAAATRGVNETILHPKFDWATHYPPRDLKGIKGLSEFTSSENLIMKRLVFNKEKLTIMKEKAITAEGSQVKDPTRVEVVCAFIWKSFIEAEKSGISSKKISASSHAVNLRPRVTPPLPEGSIGNFCWFVVIPTFIQSGVKHHELIAQLRNTLRSIDSEYVTTIKTGECLNELKARSENLNSDVVSMSNFSSWCRFPLYEVDFGWGKPAWVCTTSIPIRNLVLLMSTKDGEGIEAWVTMLKGEMAVLERDFELLSLASSSV